MEEIGKQIGNNESCFSGKYEANLTKSAYNCLFIGTGLVLTNSVQYVRGSCKKFCHWVRITSVLRFIKHIFITNLQSIPLY